MIPGFCLNKLIGRGIAEAIVKAVWVWPEESKYIKKRNEGVTLYKVEGRNEFTRSFKTTPINRRLETKRIRTYNRK